MRVVAGIAGGRRLVAPAGTDVRPTSDRVREAMFNALESLGALEGSRVLDLYAGSGALGIEALSRGAASVTFVDDFAAARRAVATNLASIGFSDRADLRPDDARRYLAASESRYDVVLLDPPYAFAGWPRLLVGASARLGDGGVIVAESGTDVGPAPGLTVVRLRRYGGTIVTFFRHTTEGPPPSGDLA